MNSMMRARRIGMAVGCFALAFATAGDVHAMSCVRVRAETAELELSSVTVDGKSAGLPAVYTGTTVTVYRHADGSVQLRAKRGPEWLWEERLEP
jgi:hypothetical protein